MSTEALVASAAIVALKSTAELLLIWGLGCALARTGLLHRDTRRMFARFGLLVFYPLLALSAPKNYDARDFVQYFVPLCCLSTMHILGGFGLATAAAKLFRLPPQERVFVQLMVAFGNNMTLPFLLISAICVSWRRVNSDPDTQGRAYAMIILCACLPP